MFFIDQWISRRQVILYVAHVASGVHSGSARKADELALQRIRECVRYITLPGPGVEFDLKGFDKKVSDEFKYSVFHVDPVLAEVHASIGLLVHSPDVIKLEKVISSELGLSA